MLADRYGGCVWEIFRSAGLPIPVLHTYTQLPPLSKCKRNGVSPQIGTIPMIKPTPNPPVNEAPPPYEALNTKELNQAVERAPDHHATQTEQKQPKRNGQLFSVCPDINTEALLANASEDLLSISAIAADLADDVDGSRRSVTLAISRVAEGAHLLVERALDHLEEPEMAAILTKQQSGLD